MQDQTSMPSKFIGLGHTERMAKPKPWKEIGERLKAARLALDYDIQREFAENAGLKKTQYQNWESGYSRISTDGARALRRTYGLSLDFIYEGNVAMLPNKVTSALRDKPRDNHSK